MPRKLLPNAAPKPKPAPPKKPQFSSIKRPDYKDAILAAQRLRSTTPLKKKKRSKSEAAAKLDREYGGPERLTWLHSLPCVACGYRGPEIEAAHVISGGTSRKADARWTVPLCGPHDVFGPLQKAKSGEEFRLVGMAEGCHRKSHRMGQKSFESFANVDLKSAASRTEAAWQAYAFSKSGAR